MKKKLLVTGGSGFIGRHMAAYFSAEYDVSAPAHSELDLCDTSSVDGYFRGKDFDGLVHCAVRPGHRNARDSSSQLYINTRMFFNLVRHQGRFGRMVLLSSGLVYGLNHYIPGMKEDYFGAFVPEDEGGLSKFIEASYAAKAGNIVELRPFGVYGPYEDYQIRFISNAICKTIFDLPVTIKQDRLFSYVWVEDLVRVAERGLAGPMAFPSYNVTPLSPVLLSDIAGMVIRIGGKKLPVRIGKPGLGTEYSGDSSRLRAELPGFPFTSLESGIEQLYKWYSDNRGSINQSLLMSDK